MSKQRKIHLFNCDRTYKLDAVVEWLNAAKDTAKSKLGLELTTPEKQDFSLSQMTELSSKIIPELDMDVAVFVVHAHESRLSINEENAGIGYAKIYRALLHATKDNVIIVIGGDDSYKDKDEEDKEFISRWARRKISSQFSEEFLDGRKSFVFSWDKKHREIHEEALLHFFDKTKKGQKFEYQPKRKLPQRPAMSLSSKVEETTGRLNQEESKSQQRWGESGLHGWDTSRFEDKPKTKDPYPIASAGHATKEHAALYTEKADNFQRLGGSNPLQCDTFEVEKKPKTTFPSTTSIENAARSTERAGRFQETAPPRKDLSVVGWIAKQESLSAVTQLIQKHRDILNLSTDPDVLNLEVNDMISYLENNPLKYCVLVVDAEKVKAARDQKPGDNYLRLLQTAERNVAEKIIITVCCPRSLSKKDKSIVNRIEESFHDKSKVYVTWFVNGKLELTADDFIVLFTSAIKNTEPCPQYQSGAAQIRSFETNQSVYAQTNAVSGASRDIDYNNAFADTSHGSYPHGKTEDHPLKPPNVSFDYKIFLPTGKTVLVDTRLYGGKISKRPEDVRYWMPGFDVPAEIVRGLLNENWKNPNAELVILFNEEKRFVCRVDKKKEKEWKESIRLALDETVVLQTRLKYGQISFESKDVVIRYQNCHVPQKEANRLMENYQATPAADLFVVSDSKGNARVIVQVGAVRKFFTFINKTVGKNVI